VCPQLSILYGRRGRGYIITNITITTNANFEGPTTRRNKHYNERELLCECVVCLFLSLSLSLLAAYNGFNKFSVSSVSRHDIIQSPHPLHPSLHTPDHLDIAQPVYYIIINTRMQRGIIITIYYVVYNIILGTYLYLYDIHSRRPSTKAFQTTANSSRAFLFRL